MDFVLKFPVKVGGISKNTNLIVARASAYVNNQTASASVLTETIVQI